MAPSAAAHDHPSRRRLRRLLRMRFDEVRNIMIHIPGRPLATPTVVM
jgi:hypothetical protein